MSFDSPVARAGRSRSPTTGWPGSTPVSLTKARKYRSAWRHSAATTVCGIGAIHVDLTGFLFGQLHSVTVAEAGSPAKPSTAHAPVDPARMTWAVAKFGAFFFGTLQRIYVPEVGTMVDALFHPRKINVNYKRR